MSLSAKIVDVSSYQHPNGAAINWAQAVADGVTGVIVKATEGTGYVNPYFAGDVKAAHAAGLPVGFYHFAEPGKHAAADEAEWFLSHLRGHRWEIKLALDFETSGPHMTDRQLEAWARAFNACVHDATGQWPMFYSYSAFIQGLDLGRTIGNGLWLANYGPNDGRRVTVAAPSPWRRVLLHQYTSVGRVGGIQGNVDVSYAPSMTGLLVAPASLGYMK